MPIIQVNMLEGRTVEQKRDLARRMTEAAVGALGVKPQNVRILIHELGPYDFAVAGIPAAENGKMPPKAGTA